LQQLITKPYEKPHQFCLKMPDKESNVLGQKLIIKHGPFDGIWEKYNQLSLFLEEFLKVTS